MYNAEIKEEFINTQKRKVEAARVMESFSGFEENLSRDICEFSRAQIIDSIQGMGTYMLSTIESAITVMKTYCRWCYDKGLFDGALYGGLGITAKEINPKDAIINGLFSSEEDLLQSLNTATDIHDGNPAVIACLLAWIGIGDPTAIHDSDVFLDGRKIFQNGLVIVDGFSDAIFEILTEYRRIKTSSRNNGLSAIPLYKDMSTDLFIKRFCSQNSSKYGKPMDIPAITCAIDAINQNCKERHGELFSKFRYKNILHSGSLNRLYKAELSGLDVMNSENENEITGMFYKTKYRSIRWLYPRYKQAFNL